MINEKEYQHHLEQELNGKHLKNKHGITDVTTDDTHVEIKKWSDYKTALGQLLSYNNAVPKNNLSVYFFGHYPEEKKKEVSELFIKNSINVYQCSIKVEPLKLINENSLEMFINKFIKKSTEERVFCGHTWKTYIDWCDKNGFIYEKQKDFEFTIESFYQIKKKKIRKGMTTNYGWIGIALLI